MQPAGFYVSTSRKPSVRTRKLARWLPILLGGKSENRGKRSVRELVSRAEKNGLPKLLLVYEDHGNPSQLWLLDEEDWRACVNISVKKDKSVPKGKRVNSRMLTGSGKVGRKIAELLSSDEPEEEPAGRLLEINCTDSGICFSLDGKRVGPSIVVLGLELVEPGETGEASD
jgi:hypothetical protein